MKKQYKKVHFPNDTTSDQVNKVRGLKEYRKQQKIVAEVPLEESVVIESLHSSILKSQYKQVENQPGEPAGQIHDRQDTFGIEGRARQSSARQSFNKTLTQKENFSQILQPASANTSGYSSRYEYALSQTADLAPAFKAAKITR